MPVIIGIDPSLRSTGYGIIRTESRETRSLAYGVIKNSDKLQPSRCLVAIHQQITDLLQKYQPEAAAVEGIIYLQNYRTAITLGSARGAALLALAEAGLPIYEYAPRRVKAAATGRGAAQKAQVGFMMRALLGLTENPPPDAADALALALTHAQNTGVRTRPKEI
ncbi:MAG TPA: crossover junction endodeoxyribonuclease RuvC [Candidatus Methylacidiphilales bacterium]|nr:crossover junction endodeoxyribonuclease RuvC [Candidatus Methylacidiphilales bacterium]